MKIKKIRAKNFSEALALVRKELGGDAVILSSEDRKGSNPFVEVTAAIDEDIEMKSTGKTRYAAAEGKAKEGDGLIELQRDIQGLKQSIESMKNCGFELKLTGKRKNLFHFLKEKSIKEEFALEMVERAGDIGEIEMRMTDDLNVSVPDKGIIDGRSKKDQRGEQKLVMLIGPSGVGKTTTIAKLASKAVQEGRKTAVISIDTFKIGAVEQIRIYSRMIGIPLDVVSGPDRLRQSIGKFSDRDMIFIDTTGQNPRDREYISGLKNIYETGLPIETQLLLSTSSDSDFLIDTHRHYRDLPIDYIAFTKTDEAVRLGSIYNLTRIYRKPVAYVTTGQRVPGNIEFIDSKQITNLILRTGSA